MIGKLKPCALCASIPDLRIEDNKEFAHCQTTECELSRYLIPRSKWNNRPLEDKLKSALDVFFKAIPIALDENYTHKNRTRRMRDALDDAKKILGIVKTNK